MLKNIKKISAVMILSVFSLASLNSVHAEDLGLNDLDSLLNNTQSTSDTTTNNDTVKATVINDTNNGTEPTVGDLKDVKISSDGKLEQYAESKNFIIKAKANKDITVNDIVKDGDFKLNDVKEKIQDVFSIRYVKGETDETVFDDKTIIPKGADVYLLAKEDNASLTDYPVFNFTLNNDNITFLQYGEVKLDGSNEMKIKGNYVYEKANVKPVKETVVKTDILKDKKTGVVENILLLSIILVLLTGVTIVRTRKS